MELLGEQQVRLLAVPVDLLAVVGSRIEQFLLADQFELGLDLILDGLDQLRSSA